MKKSLIFFLFITGCSSLFAQWQYPTSKKVEVSDTYFGVTYNDNYRWLEDMKNPEVNTWFKAQADLTNATMNTIAVRTRLTEHRRLWRFGRTKPLPSSAMAKP